tara:strand:- start:537 stop:692 length:156 start_codon:yes stop_codon:yes gene_type:complete
MALGLLAIAAFGRVKKRIIKKTSVPISINIFGTPNAHSQSVHQFLLDKHSF